MRACACASRAPWVRKNGNPSMREILVKANGMARGRVRLRPTAYSLRRTSPQMTFLHEVVFTQRTLASWLFEKMWKREIEF